MSDLVTWLRAQIDADERIARGARADYFTPEVLLQFSAVGDATHVVRHDPARVLRQVAAMRKIVDLHAKVDFPYDHTVDMARHDVEMSRAVIYHPNGDPGVLDMALAHCRRRSYAIDSIVDVWEQAIVIVRAGWADVVVVGTRGDLHPDRVPRWEIADEWPTDAANPRPIRLRPADGPRPTAADPG